MGKDHKALVFSSGKFIYGQSPHRDFQNNKAKKTTNSSLIDSIFLAIALEICLLLCYTNSFRKGCFCAVETKDEVVNVTNQWAGLCFYSCTCVCKLCRPPADFLSSHG
jgi:hypothetical protein